MSDPADLSPIERAKLAREVARAKKAQADMERAQLAAEAARKKAEESPAPKIERTMTAPQLAAAFNLKPSTIRGWPKDGCPHDNLGKGRGRGCRYNLEEVRQWIHRTRRRIKHGGAPSEDPDTPEAVRLARQKADLRKSLAMALRYELDYELRKGQLLEREAVERGLSEHIAYARARLMGGPAALAPDLVGEDAATIERALSAWVRSVLEELAGVREAVGGG